MAEITGKDPELHLENAREARMTVENHTADESSTLAGVGKRHRTREAPTQTPTPSPSLPQLSLPQLRGTTFLPGFHSNMARSPWVPPLPMLFQAPAPLLLCATLLDPAAPPPSRDLRHCSIAPDPLAVR